MGAHEGDGGGDGGGAVELVAPNGCSNVGQAMPDLAGIGVLLSFAGQALLSLVVAVWVFFVSRMGALERDHLPEDSEEHRHTTKKLETFSEILMAGNDIQMLLGIALQATAYTKRAKLGLYHLRLVYDTVSFVGVSSAAALVCLAFCHAKLHRPLSRLSVRYIVTYIFAGLFIALTVVLIVHLSRWDVENPKPGYCYSTSGTNPIYAPHPTVDLVYVCFTAAWLLGVMLWAAVAGPRPRYFLLAVAFLQYPVHLYFTVALRHANQKLLRVDGETEDEWDFGQTTAILLLVLAYIEVGAKTREYWRWRKRETRREKGGSSGVSLASRSYVELRSIGSGDRRHRTTDSTASFDADFGAQVRRPNTAGRMLGRDALSSPTSPSFTAPPKTVEWEVLGKDLSRPHR